MKSNRSVVVIGAGLSGLTAAYRLQEAGFTVRVLERSGQLGGRVRTIEKNGYIIDVGADAITDGYDEYLQLAKDIGFGEFLVPVSPELGMVKNNRIETFNLEKPLSMVTMKLLSWPAKIGAAKGMLAIRKGAKNLFAHSMYEKAEFDDPHSNAGAMNARVFGQEAADYLFNPVVKMYNGTRAENCSTADAYIGPAISSHKTMAVAGGQDTAVNWGERVAQNLIAHLASI